MERERNREYPALEAESYVADTEWSKWANNAYYILQACVLYGTPMGRLSLLYRFGNNVLYCFTERTRRDDEYRRALLERRREEHQHQ